MKPGGYADGREAANVWYHSQVIRFGQRCDIHACQNPTADCRVGLEDVCCPMMDNITEPCEGEHTLTDGYPNR